MKKKATPPVPMYAKNGNYVGTLVGNILKKQVRGSVHKFRAIGENGSWGIDYEILHAKLKPTMTVRIIDTEARMLYQTTVKKWIEQGSIKHFKEGTTDHYTQVFLPLEFFLQVKQ